MIELSCIVEINYRCSKGHEWTSGINGVRPITIYVAGHDDERLASLCPYCLTEFLEKALAEVGRAERVK